MTKGKVTEIDSSLLLTNEDRASGFSITADGHHNISLLRWSKLVAWFSAMLSEETIRVLLELIRSLPPDREERNAR